MISAFNVLSLLLFQGSILSLYDQHPAAVTLGAYYIFSSIVSGMPSPKPESGMGYIWAFNSLHLLAGSAGRVVARKYGNGYADEVPKEK